MKRLFLAINLPKKHKKTLKEKREEIKVNFEADPVKWVSEGNLHITLAFIGDVKESKIDVLREDLNKINFASISLNFGEIKYIPNRRKAKLIWVESKSDALTNLKKRVDDFLENSEAINYQSDDREFIPHITLGRIKSFKFKKIPLEEIPLLEDEFVDISFTVKSFELMESKLKKRGPSYKIIESYE